MRLFTKLFLLGVAMAAIARNIFAQQAQKLSDEYAAALKTPVLFSADNPPILNPNFGPFNVTFFTPEAGPKLCASVETPRAIGHTIGCGSAEEMQADLTFMAENLYGDANVTKNYASGKSYTPSDALFSAINRFAMFAKRAWDLGSPFTGIMFQTKADNSRIGLVNIGNNGLGFGDDTVEAAILIDAEHQKQGFGTELLGGMFFGYVPAIKARGDKTLAGADFNAVSFSSSPGVGTSSIADKFGIPQVGTSDIYGPDAPKNVYKGDVMELVDTAARCTYKP